MTQPYEQGSDSAPPPDRLSQATTWFMRLRAEDAATADLTSFQGWLAQDPGNAAAYARVSES
jgi:ferric-dicitrate binding protein FerR (iron transport regulator)